MPNEIEYELGELGKLRGRVTWKAARDIEAKLGGIQGIAKRFALSEAGFGESAVILHRFTVEAMGADAPKLADLERELIEVGGFRAVKLAQQLVERAMYGASDEDGEPDSPEPEPEAGD